ncbi:MAG: hypothetical protein IAE89_01180 [Anaerolineae bacterium]|nr:hypothetical protein [Anaerolineae bacterium]
MRRWLVFLITTTAILSLVLGVGMTSASPAAQATPAALGQGVDVQEFFFDARADLEGLADAALGQNTRPEGWTGDFDPNSVTFASDLWYDSELLADTLLGVGERPAEWESATVVSPEALVRSVRRNIETMANEQFGIGSRPDTWRGAPVLLLCDRTLLNTLSMLALFYRFEPITPDSALNYCLSLQAEVDERLNEIVFSTPNENGVVRDPIPLLSGARGDLERLADELLGLNTRPEGYIGNRDATSPTFIGDLFLDLNSLAKLRLGEGVRPDGWIGAVSSSPGSSYYNLRHDLELLAEATLPPEREQSRPTGWQGIDPIEQCRPGVTYLYFLVTEGYDLSFNEIDPFAPDFCDQLEEALNAVVENPPVLDEVVVEVRLTGSADYAFTYLDVAALQYMGIMPGGTPFRAVYRNFGASNMMFVVGDQFAVYVDRRFTTVPETVFNSLPTLENVQPVAFCDAFWCNGPGPTPTPTGSTPLELVLFGSTQQATPNQTELETTKQLVSWNFVRVTYISDNPAARTAQVTLELCFQNAQVATECEPVAYVFDNAAGAEKPVVGTQNGLNIFEFRYGYSTNLIIESETLYATDVWISDPTIR